MVMETHYRRTLTICLSPFMRFRRSFSLILSLLTVPSCTRGIGKTGKVK